MFSVCVVIPVYNHPQVIQDLVDAIVAQQIPVLLVDDGSDIECAKLLLSLSESIRKVHLLRLPENLGKGGAVKAGLVHALGLGYSHAIQIDADGQHRQSDIEKFVNLAREKSAVLISGRPVYDASVPRLRYYSRYLTHVWVWINTLSLCIQDSMCGFRVYPLVGICQLIHKVPLGNRMDFDTEIMVRWYWDGGDIAHLDTIVKYPEGGISHFRGWEDNYLISKMHARLFFGMLIRIPSLLMRHLDRGVT